MSNNTGLSPQSPTKYVGPNVYLPVVVTRTRAPTSADYRQPETGKLYSFDTYWLVGKDPSTGTYGDLWYLANIQANIANWIKLSSGTSGPLLGIILDASTAPGTNPVLANSDGMIQITGAQVNQGVIGTNVLRTNSLNINEFTIEIQRSYESSTPDITKNGVCHFNLNDFSVDASTGFVSAVSVPESIVQQVRNKSTTSVSTTKNLDPTGTTPTTSNTDSILTCSITPTSDSNILQIEFTVPYSADSDGVVSFCLFEGSTFLTGWPRWQNGSIMGRDDTMSITYYLISGSTSSLTFDMRWAGGSGLTTVRSLQNGSGTPFYNGAGNSAVTFTITEVTV